MSVNRNAIASFVSGEISEVDFVLYFLGTYGDKGGGNGTGDLLDLTASTNPGDGTSINPNALADVFFSRVPITSADNNGDMGGAYVGIVKGATPGTFHVRFYQANGTELTTGAAYPNLGQHRQGTRSRGKVCNRTQTTKAGCCA